MRYIIIPLVIVLYIIWTIKSVKNIIKYGIWYCEEDDLLLFWLVLHSLAIVLIIVGLSIYYW